MKCEYLHDVHEPRPLIFNDPERQKKMVERGGQWYWPAGTIEEHPKAYILVRMGTAKPADDECTLAAAMSTPQQATAQKHNEVVRKGIHPDDYQRYFDGVITGYDIDGNDIPGPNWDGGREDDEDDD